MSPEKKRGEGGKRQEKRRKQPGLVVQGGKRTAMNLRLRGSVVECLSSKPRALGSTFSAINKQTNWKQILGSPHPACRPLALALPSSLVA